MEIVTDQPLLHGKGLQQAFKVRFGFTFIDIYIDINNTHTLYSCTHTHTCTHAQL